MADFELINSMIIVLTLFVIYGIFLFFDLFKRNERYGYLAYIVALIPVNVLWILQFDVLGVYLILFILWIFCLLRDLYGVTKEKKEINELVLYLILAIIIQLILTAILPISIPTMQTNTTPYWFFYLPDTYTSAFGIESWVNPTMLFAFRVTASILIGLVVIPLLVDLKGEDVPLPVFIVLIGLFIPPFLYLSYVWLPGAMAMLTFLMSVLLFILLLLMTKSGKEVQKKK